MKTALVNFASESTLHGIGHICNAKSIIFRISWGCFFLAASIGLTINLRNLIVAYLEYGYYEIVTQDGGDGALIFPYISDCDTVGMSENTLSTTKMETTLNVIRNGQIMDFYILKKKENNDSTDQYDEYQYFMHTNRAFSAFSTVDDIPKFGVRAEDLILSCKFGIHDCSIDDFQSYLHPMYLNCYTFKGIRLDDKGTTAKTQMVGPQNGLSLILKAQDTVINPYFDPLSKTGNIRSLRVSVHEPDTLPAISESGVDILPGMSTSFGLMQKSYERLKSPYADCHDKTKYKVENNTDKVDTQFCNQICLVEHVLDKCQCISANLDVHFSNLIDDHVKSCLYLNKVVPDESVNKTHCEISELRNQLLSNTCQCKWNCEEIEYDISISQAKWPVQSALRDFLDHFVTSGHVKRIYEQLKLYYSNKTDVQSSQFSFSRYNSERDS